MTRRHRWIALAVGVVLLLATGWYLRWDIGLRAVRIVDPAVRRWAAREVRRLSEGAYILTASPIRVDTDARRVSLDTLFITTDTAANARRDAPLPGLTLRFHNCALEGIDLDQLTTGNGLQASRAGCDTVAVLGDVPRGVAGNSSGSFLSLDRDLDLSRGVPSIAIDSIRFPSVSVRLAIEGRTGRRTALAFERFAVGLDSLFYRRHLPVAERRTLYSRNATLQLDAFSGSRENADRLDIERIRADLATGSFAMYGFAWAPLPGAFADSLGLRELEIDTLALEGVDWRAFLTRGDGVVGRIVLRGTRIEMSSPVAASTSDTATTTATLPATRWVLERTLRTIDRGIHLDTLDARFIRVSQPFGDSLAVITADAVALAGVHFGFDDAAWGGPQPLGPVRLAASGIERRWGDYRTALTSFALDLGQGTARATDIEYGTVGTDADFTRRRRWRTDRISVRADSLEMSGLDHAAWVRHGAYRAAHVGVAGLHLDVFNDKRRPARRNNVSRRFPQEWLRTSGLDLHIDSATIRGRVTYRERGATSRRTGVLRFEALQASLTNGGNDPARIRGDSTVRLHATARLMGAGALTVDVAIPIFATQFDADWSGSLGRMPATAFNELVTGISALRFNEGIIERIDFQAATRRGVSRGTVQPRWRDLSVELPGIARTGILQGLRRAIAKFAANQFVVRGDNVATPDGAAPVNGVILHRWLPRETLLQHLWISLRDALVTVMKL